MTGRARSRARGRTRVPEVSSQPLAPRLVSHFGGYFFFLQHWFDV